jgi:hypothetical protein
MEDHRCVEFTGVEFAGGTELASLVEKVTTGSVKKAMVGHSGGEDGSCAREGHSG